MQRLMIYFVNEDKRKNKMLESRSKIQDNLTMIIVELPWGWELYVSKKLKEIDDGSMWDYICNMLDSICERENVFTDEVPNEGENGWFPEEIFNPSGFWRISGIKKVNDEQISRLFESSNLSSTVREMREGVVRKPKIKSVTLPKPKKEPETLMKREYFDGKMASSGEREDD